MNLLKFYFLYNFNFQTILHHIQTFRLQRYSINKCLHCNHPNYHYQLINLHFLHHHHLPQENLLLLPLLIPILLNLIVEFFNFFLKFVALQVFTRIEYRIRQ